MLRLEGEHVWERYSARASLWHGMTASNQSKVTDAEYPFRVIFLREDPFKSADVRRLAKHSFVGDWKLERGPKGSNRLMIGERRDFRTALLNLDIGGPQLRRVLWEDGTTGRSGRIWSTPQEPSVAGGLLG